MHQAMPKTRNSHSTYAAVATSEEDCEEELHPSRSKSAWSSYSQEFCLPMLCTVVGIFLGLVTGAVVFAARDQLPSPSHGFVPDMPIVVQTWDQDFRYALKSRESDHFWDELMPVGNGRLRIETPHEYGLPAGEPIVGDPKGAEMYAVSVTHQLHCLALLRTVIIDYENGIKSHWAEEDHVYHCIDYLRHGIVCAADMTIEWPKKRLDGNRTEYITDGQGSQHQCKDWNAIKSFLEVNRATDSQSILGS